MSSPSSKTRGFTLVELLVVIAIISLLASVVFSSIALAKTKAIDTRKKADLASVRTALQTFNLDMDRMPHNYDCSGATCVVDDARSTLAIDDAPGAPTTESGRAYNASMQELVDAKDLPGIPHSPGGAAYTYYDYGPGNAAGAVVGTALDAALPSSTGEPGSCRPFDAAPLTFLDSLTHTVHADRLLATSFPALDPNALGNDPTVRNQIGRLQGLLCDYVENGARVERPCPPDTTNLCSTAANTDYCLCNQY